MYEFSKIVSVFTMHDSFGLSELELLEEGLCAAQRRGEVEGFIAHYVLIRSRARVDGQNIVTFDVFGELIPGEI